MKSLSTNGVFSAPALLHIRAGFAMSLAERMSIEKVSQPDGTKRVSRTISIAKLPAISRAASLPSAFSVTSPGEFPCPPQASFWLLAVTACLAGLPCQARCLGSAWYFKACWCHTWHCALPHDRPSALLTTEYQSMCILLRCSAGSFQ